MLIKTIPVGQLEENCYVVTNEATLESVVIDPGDEANTILDYLESNKLKCVAIMITHGHFDHVGAVDAVAEETGATFAENAVIKARALMNQAKCAVVADDSGLVVDALDGRPGIYSARYAGVHGDDDANNRKLLKELANVPAPRTARFACAVALLRPGHEPLVCEGTCEGEIGFEKKGDGDFGYDPLFYYPPFDKTFAEMTANEKNSVSHRGRAVKAFCEKFFG